MTFRQDGEPQGMSVESGSRVKIAFTATYPDGDLFDTSSETVAAEHGGVDADKRFRPIVLEVGAEPGIRSLEDGLLGLAVGDETTIEVPHEDLQVEYDREEFEAMTGEPATEGADVHALTGLLGTVVAVDEDTVTVDYDPDRAGQALTFEVEILEVD